MTAYNFVANNFPANWSNPAIWNPAQVPNDPTADVSIVYDPALRLPSYADIIVNTGEAFSVRSLTLSDNQMEIHGALTVAGSLVIQTGPKLFTYVAQFFLNNGSLTAGTLVNNGSIQGQGTINATSFTNTGTVVSTGLAIAANALTNTGTLSAAYADMTVIVTAGRFSNLSGGVLTGGTYTSGGAHILALDVGGPITTDAAVINLGGGSVGITVADTSGANAVPLQSTLRTIAASGVLNLDQFSWTGKDLTVDGVLTLAEASTVAVPQLTVDPSGSVRGVGAINAPVVNNGTISADAGGFITPSNTALYLAGPITGGGALKVAAGLTSNISTLELGGATSETVQFGNGLGVLQLDKPATFTGRIAPARGGDQVAVGGISLSSVTGYSYAQGSGGGVLTINTASGPTTLQFQRVYSTASFTFGAGPQSATLPASLLITVGASAAHTPLQLGTYYADVMRTDFNAIPAADLATLQSLAAQVSAGTLSEAAAEAQVARLAINTTSVANLAYSSSPARRPTRAGSTTWSRRRVATPTTSTRPTIRTSTSRTATSISRSTSASSARARRPSTPPTDRFP